MHFAETYPLVEAKYICTNMCILHMYSIHAAHSILLIPVTCAEPVYTANTGVL